MFCSCLLVVLATVELTPGFIQVPDPGQWSVNCIPCQNIYAHGLNAVFVIKYKVRVSD